MNRYKRYIPIIAFVLVSLGVGLEKFGIDLDALSRGDTSSLSNLGQSGSEQSHPTTKKWSSTSPEINLWHIFEGEINRREKPTGYHSRPGGVDAPNARVVSLIDRPNNQGVYTATIEVRDGSQWKRKRSSFFPDSMSRDEVLDVIIHAYKNKQEVDGSKFRGPSGLGFTVEGYTSRQGGINTAYPIFR